MRLNAWLARAGVASRRGADELIKAGRVTVNGEPGRLDTFVVADDRVELDGRALAKQPLAYVLLHKPAGVVTTARDPQGRPTVVELVDHGSRVVPVGRLDADTTGVLLLTNDGELAHRLAHPRYEVDKTYVAEVEGDPDDHALLTLEEGVDLDDGRTAPARARRLARGRVELTIHEGRKHQVKRMLAAVGHAVITLHRSRYGPLTVDGLEPGAWRELAPDEVESLRGLSAAGDSEGGVRRTLDLRLRENRRRLVRPKLAARFRRAFGQDVGESDVLGLEEADRLAESVRERVQELSPTRTWPDSDEAAVFGHLVALAEFVDAGHVSCLLLLGSPDDIAAVRVRSRVVLERARAFWERGREPLCLLTTDLACGLYLDHTPADQMMGDDEYELWIWGDFAEGPLRTAGH